MKFQLPQFIQTQIKIVGPFTLQQFLWVGAGAALLFADFSLFHGAVPFIVGIPIAAFFAAFAFLRIDDMPLVNYVGNALSYMLGQKQYIYRQDESKDITPDIHMPQTK